jgi:hypothetical protein
MLHPTLDPLKFGAVCWPQFSFYDKEAEVILSVRDNDETIVPAANMMGKDFVAGFIALWFFLAFKQCRVVSTSVKDDHLRVLWGEIGRFIQSSVYPLTVEKGGPLIVHHRDIRKVNQTTGKECKISYLRGMVSEKGEGMAGHHAQATLAIIDEASGVDDVVYTQCATWAKRFLIFGNTNQCENFFRRMVEAGDVIDTEMSNGVAVHG